MSHGVLHLFRGLVALRWSPFLSLPLAASPRLPPRDVRVTRLASAHASVTLSSGYLGNAGPGTVLSLGCLPRAGDRARHQLLAAGGADQCGLGRRGHVRLCAAAADGLGLQVRPPLELFQAYGQSVQRLPLVCAALACGSGSCWCNILSHKDRGSLCRDTSIRGSLDGGIAFVHAVNGQPIYHRQSSQGPACTGTWPSTWTRAACPGHACRASRPT